MKNDDISEINKRTPNRNKKAESMTQGRLHRLVCQGLGGRQLRLLSDCEFATFLQLYWDPSVVDVQARVVCEIDATLRLADELGIKHPTSNRFPVAMHTDLVATTEKDGRYRLEAYSVKHYQWRPNKRGTVLMELERRYYEERGASWKSVQSHGLNDSLTKNMFWLFQFAESAVRDGFNERQLELHSIFLEGVRKNPWLPSIFELCKKLAATGAMGREESAQAFRELLAAGYLETDLDVPLLHNMPPRAFKVAGYANLNLRRHRLGKRSVGDLKPD